MIHFGQKTHVLVKVLICSFSCLGLLNCGSGGAGDTTTNAGPSVPTVPVACTDSAPPTPGNTFYLDPVNGANDQAGTFSEPWGALASVLADNMIETRAYDNLPYDGTNALVAKNPGAPVKAGDTLVLLSGHHGEFDLRGAYNEFTIYIQAAPGHRPTLSRIRLSAAANWHFDGLTVSPSTSSVYTANTLIHIESHGWHGPSSHVIIQNCDLFSVEDSSGWDMDAWNNFACNAISVSGDCMTVRNNTALNVDHGITVSGNTALVRGNTIENFSGDGMRGLGNDLTFEYNVVKNCYDVNANHDDGFQSWSINDDPPRERVILRGNTIINYEDPNQPFRGTLQGIGCFDGPYQDWVVENNLVITDHWHGITLQGAHNSRIVNNTVVDRNDAASSPTPWIAINPHKNGTPSQGCIIRNNIAPKITASGDTVADHNHLLIQSDDLFEAPDAFNYHLKGTAVAVIDRGSTDLAPDIDLDGLPRPSGSRVDIGCYESP